MSNVGSIPSRPTEVDMARCDVGICSQTLNLAITGSIPVRVTLDYHDVVELADTRRSERRAHWAWEFESPLRDFRIAGKLVLGRLS